jgi:hypothetical protein
VPNSTVVTGDVLSGSMTLTADFQDWDQSSTYPAGTAAYVGTLGGGWTTGWTEVNETTSATGNDIRLQIDPDNIPNASNYILRFNKKADRAIYRTVNLSPYSSASLSFDWRRDGLNSTTDRYFVEVCTLGATCGVSPSITNWTTLKEINWTTSPDVSATGGTDATTYHTSSDIDLTSHISANTRIRVRVGTNNDQNVYFDNFVIYAEKVDTLTKDNVTGGANPDLLNGVPENLVVSGDNFMLESALSAPVTVTSQVSFESDNAEESINGTSPGRTLLDSSDLELGGDYDWAQQQQQWVGMRFRDITVPTGAIVTNAYITFVADVDDNGTNNATAASFNVYGQDADTTAGFVAGASNFNISTRPRTAPVAWTLTTGDAWTVGQSYDTPVRQQHGVHRARHARR